MSYFLFLKICYIPAYGCMFVSNEGVAFFSIPPPLIFSPLQQQFLQRALGIPPCIENMPDLLRLSFEELHQIRHLLVHLNEDWQRFFGVTRSLSATDAILQIITSLTSNGDIFRLQGLGNMKILQVAVQHYALCQAAIEPQADAQNKHIHTRAPTCPLACSVI